MKEYQSLSHTRWDCKYHVVFIPKRRKKRVFGALRRHLGKLFHELASHEEAKIVGGHRSERCALNLLLAASGELAFLPRSLQTPFARNSFCQPWINAIFHISVCLVLHFLDAIDDLGGVPDQARGATKLDQIVL